MFVQFTSNASAIFLTYTVRDSNLTSFSNFSPIGEEPEPRRLPASSRPLTTPPAGYSGMDLYRRSGGPGSAWRWVSSTFNGLSDAYNSGSSTVTESPLFVYADGWPVGPVPPSPTVNDSFVYRLHLPSYNGVLQVGGEAAGLVVSTLFQYRLLPPSLLCCRRPWASRPGRASPGTSPGTRLAPPPSSTSAHPSRRVA